MKRLLVEERRECGTRTSYKKKQLKTARKVRHEKYRKEQLAANWSDGAVSGPFLSPTAALAPLVATATAAAASEAKAATAEREI